MAKTTDQVLQEAANAAKKALPEAEKEVESAERRLAEARAKLGRLRTVVAAGYPDSGVAKFSRSSGAVTFDAPSSGPVHTYSSRPPMRSLISVVLSESGKPLTPQEIGKRVETTSGSSIAQSTLYYTLTKGEELGLYKKEEDGRWTTTAKSEGR
jgi:hypothetical protein